MVHVMMLSTAVGDDHAVGCLISKIELRSSMCGVPHKGVLESMRVFGGTQEEHQEVIPTMETVSFLILNFNSFNS